MTDAGKAVFLSYASENVEAAERIAEALRGAGVEVWFDKSELRGGDAWDRQIRERIHDCRLFIAMISAHTQVRDEGYFRREWKLAVDRTHDMLERKAFLLPIAIDATPERGAAVPDKFHEVQWTRLPDGKASPEFVARIKRLLEPGPPTTAQLPVDAAPSSSPTSLTTDQPSVLRHVLPVAVALLVLAALAYVLINKPRISKPAATAAMSNAVSSLETSPPAFTPPQHSIAVLPFVDMSEKKDQEYFSDGLSEELIDMLTKIPGLRVPARTSSFYFKGKSEDIQTIGKRLMVAHVLEGSVRKAGKHIRITAQLIRADNGYHLWSETYDRKLDDVFKIQDEIASAVVHALEVSLVHGSATPGGSIRSADAYQLYLQALFIYPRASTPADFRRITGHLEQSLKLDPEFAPAWAFLSSMLFGSCGSVSCDDIVEKARRAAARALALDPTLPSAHTALAKIRLLHDWDWIGAQSEAKRALELNPGDGRALAWSGYVAWALGDLEQALDLLQRDAALDPLNPHAWQYLANAFIHAGRLDDAQTSLINASSLNPTESDLHRAAAQVMLAKGEFSSALTEIARDGDEENRAYVMSCAYYALGKRSAADAALADLREKFAKEAAEDIASVYAFRGDIDEGFKWLGRAYQQHEVGLTWVKADSAFKNLRPDPRWKPFLRKMKLPD